MYGQKLRELRKIEGWTQEQVANKLGVSKQTYSHYENENRKPSLDTIRKLASVYQVDIDMIFSTDEFTEKDEIMASLPGLSKEKKKAFDMLMSFSDEDVQALIELMEKKNNNN